MRNAFGGVVNSSEISNWRIPGLWWLGETDILDISEDREIPGVSQLDDRYWGRISKIALDWSRETRTRIIGTPIESSHLQLGLSEERVTTQLEFLLREKFPVLEWICESPEVEVRLEELKLPIDRSRRISKGAIANLASHSEDWLRVTTRGPIPKRIISAIREDDFTIYENRLVRTLIDRSDALLGVLIDAIRKDEKAKNDLRGTTESHRKSRRIYGSLGAESTAESTSEILKRREKIEELRSSLRSLRQSILGLATNDIQGVNELHITNLLANEQRYREMVPLWEALRNYEGSTDGEKISLLEKWLVQQKNLLQFLELLIFRSLEFIGAREVGIRKWKLAGVEIELVAINNFFTIILSKNANVQERINLGILGVALGINPDNSGTTSSINDLLNFLSSKTEPKNQRCVLLHLAIPDEVTETMQSLVIQDAFESKFRGKTWFENGGILPLPVHPLALDSAERLGRILNQCVRRYWANHQDLSISLSEDFARIENEDFELDGSEFDLVRRVLTARKPNFKSPLVTRKSKTLSKSPVDYRRLNTLLNQLVEQLALERNELLSCPRFPKDHLYVDHSLIFWNETGYELRCAKCEVNWGVRICAICSSKNPTLNVATEQDWEFFGLDLELTPAKYFGSDLWSNFCEMSSDVYVCSSCAVCPRSLSEKTCQRCSVV